MGTICRLQGDLASQIGCKYTINSEIFAKSIKRHICDVKNSRLEHDLPVSVNDRMISSFPTGYICEVSRK